MSGWTNGKGGCCELDCLIQPRFFCGQMLSDHDLTVLLDWVKGKTALTRYRRGWGVVCGLDVHCISKPGSKAIVGVTPGYAIDCCGNDVIICNDATFDLSSCLKPKTDPFATYPSPAKQSVAGGEITFGGIFGYPRGEVRAFDVLIRYKESQSDPQTGLARGGCSGTTPCEYTRTREDYELYCLSCDPDNECEDPSAQRASDWLAAYTGGRDTLLADLTRHSAAPDPRQTLLGWLQHRSLYTFCFVRDWLERPTPSLPPNWFDEATFWIVQDWRNSYLRSLSEGCGPETGVRLARVWLWCRRDSAGKQQCSVVNVNPYPPFRRPVAPDCWPVRADQISLAPFIWQRFDSSYGPLRALGFSEITRLPITDSKLADLRIQLNCESIVVSCSDLAAGTELIAYTQRDYCNDQERIVSFALPQQALPERSVGP
jgi:hypothetical protein